MFILIWEGTGVLICGSKGTLLVVGTVPQHHHVLGI